MARESETQALIQRIEASRRHLGDEIVNLKEKLDVPRQLKRKVARKPWLWFGASAVTSLVITRLVFRPKRKKKKSSGWSGLLMATLPTVLKPLLKSLITREIQRRVLSGQAGSNQADAFSLPKP